MKRNCTPCQRTGFFTPGILRNFFIFSLILTLTGCSWISSRRKVFGGEEEEKKASALPMVPKAQFDDLKRRYETLLQEKRIEKAEGMDANQLANQMEQGGDPSSLVDKLSKVGSPELAETVDVFGKDSVPTGASSGLNLPASISGTAVEGEIITYRKAERALAMNKFDAALTELKKIEKSKVRQVRVRAKFSIGEIMFRQGEYDLAMQIYEEILAKDAFSGIVIKTLGRLIVCSEKLKLKKKQEQYYSMLYNFFES